jgi:IclR helix-turn-helix domain
MMVPEADSPDSAPGLAVGTSHFLPAAGPGAVSKRIVVELSRAQVDQVVRSAAESGSMSLLLSELSDVRDAIASGRDDARLSGSLLCGLLLLASLPGDGSYMSLTELARRSGRSTSTVHRYLSTLLAVGLIERDPATRRYRLADAG